MCGNCFLSVGPFTGPRGPLRVICILAVYASPARILRGSFAGPRGNVGRTILRVLMKKSIPAGITSLWHSGTQGHPKSRGPRLSLLLLKGVGPPPRRAPRLGASRWASRRSENSFGGRRGGCLEGNGHGIPPLPPARPPAFLGCKGEEGFHPLRY